MRKTVFAAALAAASLAVSSANAGLTIDVTGVPGTGVTTWTFGGTPGITSLAGTIRTNSANTFSAFDTGQFPFGQDTILNTSYQDDVFVLTGNAMITIGGNSQPLTGIFLDDDGGSADDLGVRAAADLPYLAGDTSSWSGTGTVGVDINDFAPGLWSINSVDGQAMFIDDPILVTFTVVPAPAALGLLGVAGFVVRRRRRA